MGTETDDASPPADPEIAALHQVELGLEWLQRAHGHLLAFHHNTGHAMDHFAEAEATLRESGHHALADRIRDEVLPSGVVGDRWSYDVLEDFQTGLLAEARSLESTAREDVTGGRRHVAERQLEREWRRQARE